LYVVVKKKFRQKKDRILISKYAVIVVMNSKKRLQSNKKGNDIFVVDQSHKSYIVITHKVKTGKSTKKVSEQRLSIQATRKLVELLSKTNALQEITQVAESKTVTHPPFFQRQQLLLTPALPEPPKVISQLEKKLETCRNIYKLLKTEFNDLPKYRQSKHVIHSYKEKWIHHRNGRTERKMLGTCNDTIGNALAHCHGKNKGYRYSQQICYKPKALLTLPFRAEFRADGIYNQSLVELVAHESAHHVINGKHNKRFRNRNRRHQEFLRKCELDGRLAQCEVL